MTAIETVFLDRDGVINRKKPEGDYVKSWREFEFLPGAKEALGLLKRFGHRLIIVANQRGISLGFYREQDLRDIHERMLEELNSEGVEIDGIYFCPHQKGVCSCRKPDIGLFLDAKRDFPEIDFDSSVVIGDAPSDMEAGARLGCRRILVAESPRASILIGDLGARGITVDGVAASLLDAVTRYVIRE